MGRKLIRVLLVLVVLAIVAVGVAWLMIDRIAKAGVEKGGTYAMGVPTTLEDMSVSLLGGRVTMDGLNVANPAGFNSDRLMHSGRFDLEVDAGSLLGETVNVKRFELDGLELNVEQQAAGSNVGKIIENLKQLSSGKTDEPAEPEDGEGKKVKVDRIVVRNVHARFYLLSAKPISVKVPEIVLTDVTSDNAAGVAVSQLAARIVPAIVAAVVEQGQGKVPADLLNDLDGQLDDLAAAAGERTARLMQQAEKDLSGAATKAAGDLGREADKVSKGVGDLLRGLGGPTTRPAETPEGQ